MWDAAVTNNLKSESGFRTGLTGEVARVFKFWDFLVIQQLRPSNTDVGSLGGA